MSEEEELSHRLDPPVDPAKDHILGRPEAPITLVEYGSYACPHCRAANARIAQVRQQLGPRLRYVFRHRPLTGVPLARAAAELVEQARTPEEFWRAHIELMTRSKELTDSDLKAVAQELELHALPDDQAHELRRQAQRRVQDDENAARARGVNMTPTFYINGRRYYGPWDENSFADAMLGSLGHRVRAAALDFASWAPSAGVLLLLMTIVAVAITNSRWGPVVTEFWNHPWGLVLGTRRYLLPLLDWINSGVLSLFFLVVGLEIKREVTVGHLASMRSAALPVAAALGGMLVPALLYAAVAGGTHWARGWGVPMPTDTAFAVALIVMLGRRVPLALRIFLTAAAIVDDIGTILVVAFFYSGHLEMTYLSAAAALVLMLVLLNQAHVYRVTPYLIVGVMLWLFIHAGGLHATLAGVLLAFFIPTRPPPDLNALMVQANTIIKAEAQESDEVLRRGPSLPAMRALDAIHERLESPADRMLRHLAPHSSYVVLPLFALANAGVPLSSGMLEGRGRMVTAIMLGLVVGKPLGIALASWLVVRLRWAVKPADYSWRQLLGAGALAGIGFTMALLIAEQAFEDRTDFAAAKLAVFAASILSALLGLGLLWGASNATEAESAADNVCVPESRKARSEAPADVLPPA